MVEKQQGQGVLSIVTGARLGAKSLSEGKNQHVVVIITNMGHGLCSWTNLQQRFPVRWGFFCWCLGFLQLSSMPHLTVPVEGDGTEDGVGLSRQMFSW